MHLSVAARRRRVYARWIDVRLVGLSAGRAKARTCRCLAEGGGWRIHHPGATWWCVSGCRQ